MEYVLTFVYVGEIDQNDYQADCRMARQCLLILHVIPCWNDVNSERGQTQPFSASSLQPSGARVVEQNLETRALHVSHQNIL
jgi:hypothetical protein